MNRKSLLRVLSLVTLLAAAFVGFSGEAKAGAGRRGYSYTGTSPMSGFYAQPYSPYTPGYDKYARQRYPWLFQNLPGYVGTSVSERSRVAEPGQHSSHFPPSWYRRGTKVGR